ncbi:HAD family hydrolase [Candidatus Galacturonibacter soehngenii]|uniref:HAD family hydrolase n=1 Tax=Candidatus Galacturonatibacter soehngenii TaxID=2307010 RepID=A0A7V7UAM1_9FIRM|nr:HAD family hydrolase [Candidatus Galacturonibacter soehngenii]KAB1435921.1 HAD family hydrolase [Candidatus Galacturonibacter soehngenii]
MKAIIFDLDGTLWDSTEAVAKAWNQAIKETTNLSMTVSPTQLKGLFGKPLKDIVDAIFPMFNQEEKDKIEQNLYHYEHEFLSQYDCPLYEGVPNVLSALSKQHPLFIVSNCQAGYIELFLEKTGLGDYITDFTCPGETGLLKGDNIKLIMKRNHLDSAIYVGDTQGDADACKIAQVPMIHASYGFGSVKEPDYVISKFSDLLNFDFSHTN